MEITQTFADSRRSFWTKIPNDVEIPFLGIYPEKMKTLIWKDTCPPMFIAALFTTAKTCRQAKSPSADDWFRRCALNTMEYYLAIERSETLQSSATWMDLREHRTK